MSFTIVIDNDLHFSLLELAAILDLELKSQEHHYRPLFQKLLDESNNEEIVKQLIQIPQYFLRNFSKKSFEPTTNLYIHIINLISSSSTNVNSIDLFANLLEYVDPNSSKNEDLKSTEVPSDVILVTLTSIFNSLPNNSIIRLTALSSVVNIIVKDQIPGTIQNIAKNLYEWLSTINDIETEKISVLISSVFNQYYIEDERKSIEFFKSLILSKNILLNSSCLINFFSKVLSSNSIYDITNLQFIFPQINNENLIKLLNLYLIGDYKTYLNLKSEFSSLSSINFENLESNLKSLSILNYLASTISNSNSFTYNSISNETNIPIDEIELKLITLISENFISAKLSQSTSSIIVNSINYLSPSLSSNSNLINWNEINSLLSSWNENINNLQSIVKSLSIKRGKRVNAPNVIMSFHQQKLEAREKKAQQPDDVSEISESTESVDIPVINSEVKDQE
ncbi:hypothetical protein C6P40_000344 [Pichia californica]|uniref:PCI domain-containing protein n=1 Tax=Pichia californica TaxID=460514 RepID=A0A9P6WKP5_9ASCO|nr:hypothetical protein C6P42_002314 [[Candida] californica]KAG0688944.1 hypothetical protein C6P40_000344 [[Candida] californica]